ncbi:hypothetical protein LEN26_020663, partial [Aphanomyces euteiches]
MTSYMTFADSPPDAFDIPPVYSRFVVVASPTEGNADSDNNCGNGNSILTDWDRETYETTSGKSSMCLVAQFRY